jgi:hypothetical protein
METERIRAQRYRALANKLRETAKDESNGKRRTDLAELANQYDGLAINLAERRAAEPAR